MKKLFLLILLLDTCVLSLQAQAPQKFNYQAVARDASGNPMNTATVGIQATIHDLTAAGTTLYQERFTATTNQFGLFTISIGGGAVQSGTFNGINWTSGQKWLQIEMDPAGGTSYVNMGASQFLSVPYSLIAQKVINPPAMILDDLTDVTSPAPTNGQVLTWNGSAWTPATPSSGTTYTAGTGISIAGTVITNTSPDQTVTLTGQSLATVTGTYPNFTITGNGDGWGSQTVNTDMTLSGAGTTLSPLKIAPQGATAGQVLSWNGSMWMPSTPSGGTSYTAGTGVTINGSNVISVNNLIGDVTGAPNANTVTKIQGVPVTSSTPSNGQILKYNGGSWLLSSDLNNTYTAGSGIAISGGNVISNSAPDQTVVLTGTGGTSVTGTYPNFTINSTSGGSGTVTSVAT